MAEGSGVRMVADGDGYRIAFDGLVDADVVDEVLRSVIGVLDGRSSPLVVVDLRDAVTSPATSERLRRARIRLAGAGVGMEVVGPLDVLEVSTSLAAGAATVVVSGDLDVSGVDPLLDAVDRCLQVASVVRLHLGGVTFIDASGIGGLLRCRRLAIRAGATVELVAASEIVRTTMALAQIADALGGETAPDPGNGVGGQRQPAFAVPDAAPQA